VDGAIASAIRAWYDSDAMTRRELRRENEDLRAFLGLSKPRTIDDWEMLPQEIRDPLAARAFVAEWGDHGRALVRLGFPAMNRLPSDKVKFYKEYIARVFETPGVRAILKRDLGRLDADREAILSRQCRTALYGEDAQSVRAAALIAKVCKWEFRGDPAPPRLLTVGGLLG
jgi:hypothetical protein